MLEAWAASSKAWRAISGSRWSCTASIEVANVWWNRTGSFSRCGHFSLRRNAARSSTL